MKGEQDQRFSELMRQAQSGNAASYEILLTEVAETLRAFVRGRIAIPQTAEEIVQETLISLHKARHTYRAEMPFGPWLYAIAQRRLADHFRKAGRELQETLDDSRLERFMVPELESPSEIGASLVEALADLPATQRQVIEMLKIQDLSVKEVASQLGMSESAVKVTAHRGYEILRRRFGVDNNAN